MSERRIKKLEYIDGTFEYIIENVGYYSDGYGYCYPFNNETYDTFKDAFKAAFPNKSFESVRCVISEEIVFCDYNVKEGE